MPDLPSSIQIGPLPFTITDDLNAYHATAVENGAAVWGRIEYGKGRIILDPDQTVAHKRMALFHEVLHGAWHLTDRKHEEDEALMLALSGPLLDTLRRNPALVAYLLSED